MTTKLLYEYSLIAELVVAFACALVLWRKGLLRAFRPVAAFLAVFVFERGLALGLLYFRRELGVEKNHAISIYFYSQWVATFLEYGLLLMVIYGVFLQAMQPMPGLQRMGKVIFRWVSAVSLIMALGLAVGPHLRDSGARVIVAAFAQRVVQSTSVLMLCLLLFVCFSTRPLGLSYRSRIFGVSLGMGVFSTVNLLSAAWFSMGAEVTSFYAPVYVVSSLGFVSGLLVWAAYFVMPEPERQLILLPTTSPFFFWNRISEALGDAPGQVAIAGFKPDMLAPGELHMLSIVSRTTRERQREIAEAEAREQAELARTGGLHSVPMQR